MKRRIHIFQQEFGIDGRYFVGRIERDREDNYYVVIYGYDFHLCDVPLKEMLYTGLNVEEDYISAMEDLIEDIISEITCKE